MPPLALVALLFLIAGTRQYKKLADLAERKPLRLIAVEQEHDSLGIEFVVGSVFNPNAFIVKSAYASVKDYHPSSSGIAVPLPSQGHHFPISTHEGDGMTFDIPGLCTASDKFFTPHVNHDVNTTMHELWWPLPTGYYDIEVELGSEADDLPLGSGQVRIWLGAPESFYGELIALKAGSPNWG